MTITEVLEHIELDVAPVPAALYQTSCAANPAAIGAATTEAFARLMPFIARNNLVPAGPPRAIYSDYTPEQTRFTLALPLANTAGAEPGDGVTLGMLPGGRMHRFTHQGPYPELGRTYEAITAFMKNAGLMQDAKDWMQYAPMWEEYVTDPDKVAPASLVTYIYLPVKA